MNAAPWDHDEFTRRLREAGARDYHDKHPFHLRMNAGQLSRDELRGWVANRFYYQSQIPVKDAAIVANCPLREVRRAWLHRISDQDGGGDEPGGLEAWLRLGEAAGFDRARMLDFRHVVPGVRLAVDAYVTLARTRPWPVAVAASLTEMFAPDLMAQRLAAFEKHYAWLPPWGLEYFRMRVSRARSDAEEGLKLTLQFCDTPALQEEAVGALETKCRILWAMLDAISAACAPEGRPPMTDAIGDDHRPRLAPGVRMRTDQVSGRPVLLYAETVVQLNPTGAAVLELCDGRRTVQAIMAELAGKFNVDVQLLRTDVVEYLARLRQRRLIEMDP